MEQKKYDTGIGDFEEVKCAKCNVSLEVDSVSLSYLGNGFPVDLPCCPECGMVFIPEELAMGKILHVEKALEDK